MEHHDGLNENYAKRIKRALERDFFPFLTNRNVDDIKPLEMLNSTSLIPKITASGTATCNIYVKTTPASDKYVAAGLIESNQLFQVTKTTPINGHYQIYYKQGLYYVNAKYVNLRMSNENKPRQRLVSTRSTSFSAQIRRIAATSHRSVMNVSTWSRWPMRTGAVRSNFFESDTRISCRALAMIACATFTSRKSKSSSAPSWSIADAPITA